ncbi:MAG: LysM peptidoglycan-binding domain-containing protein [Anaerolineae bacterium]|nr:LysM peptidoglycan-binding domain-containing protein [Anaerolineae bacterium]
MRVTLVLFSIAFVLAACAAPPPALTPSAAVATLEIYHTRTPSPPPPDGAFGTATPLPSATPTPRTYTVKLNDTYGTLATRFGVTVNDLVAANPGIDPNALIVGMVLIIPPEVEGGTEGVPTPTAVSVRLDPPHCLASVEGGAWCFSEVNNTQGFTVESVLVEFRISSRGEILASRLAAAPLDIIPAGSSLPVGIYFPPEVPDDMLAGATLAAALPLEDPGSRYLDAILSDITVDIADNQLSAALQGVVINQDDGRTAREVWVLAAARDRQGRVSGIRRWQWQGEAAPGQTIPFSFAVYSQLEEIESVDLYVEAIP